VPHRTTIDSLWFGFVLLVLRMLRLLMLAVILRRRHVVLRVILRIRAEGQHQASGKGSKRDGLHSSTLTVRIIPASM
jgi:hypothetical protein